SILPSRLGFDLGEIFPGLTDVLTLACRFSRVASFGRHLKNLAYLGVAQAHNADAWPKFPACFQSHVTLPNSVERRLPITMENCTLFRSWNRCDGLSLLSSYIHC